MRIVGLVFLFALSGCAVHHADPRVAKLQAELEQERGAAFSEQVTVRSEDRATYQARVRRLLAERYSPAAVARDTTILAAVGLIEPSTDLAAHVASPEGELVLAYYDPSAGEIVAIESGRSRRPISDSVLSHELAHALEDQTTGLPARVFALTGPGGGDLDQIVAAELLSEGSAICLARFLTQPRFDPPAVRRAVLERVYADSRRARRAKAGRPLLLQRLPRDLYELGPLLVHDLLQAVGWEGFVRIAQGPLSTEQVLHRDKLGEPPIAVTLPSLPFPGGWTCVGQDTLGEYYLRILLEELAGSPQDEACADWGGDRLAVYRRMGKRSGKQLAFVWRLDWDSVRAAERFVKAIGKLRGASRSPALKTAQVVRRGRRVAILGGVPAEARARVGRAVWGDAGGR